MVHEPCDQLHYRFSELLTYRQPAFGLGLNHDAVPARDTHIVAGTATFSPNYLGHRKASGGEDHWMFGEHVSVNEGRGPGLKVVPAPTPGALRSLWNCGLVDFLRTSQQQRASC